MEVLYGPTDMSARTRSVAEGTTGGHTGPPLRDHRSAQPPQRGGTEPAPYRCAAGSAQQRADVPRAWLPPAKFRNGIWGVSHRHRPLRGEGEVSATARASGAQRSVCGADGRNGWGSEQGSPPKEPSTSGNPSVSLRLTAPFTQGSLGDGDADRRVASLLAMTALILCHSEEAQRADVGIRPFYDGRWFGPPRSSAPTEGLPKSQQRADVPKAWPPPTKFRAEIWGVSHRHRPLRKYEKEEKPPRPPWPVAQSEASAPRLQGTGGNHGRDHPQSVQQPRTIPQSPSGRQLPLHKGAFPCGGRGSGRTHRSASTWSSE